jgi:hypothetical protein
MLPELADTSSSQASASLSRCALSAGELARRASSTDSMALFRYSYSFLIIGAHSHMVPMPANCRQRDSGAMRSRNSEKKRRAPPAAPMGEGAGGMLAHPLNFAPGRLVVVRVGVSPHNLNRQTKPARRETSSGRAPFRSGVQSTRKAPGAPTRSPKL